MSARLRVLRSLSAREAVDLYVRLYQEGRHGVAPDTEQQRRLFEHGEWVLACIPIDALDFQGMDESSEARVQRARDYATRGGIFPAGVARYSVFLQKRHTGRAWVQDGNHRTLAAQLRGDVAIRMLMPRGEFLAFARDARRRRLA